MRKTNKRCTSKLTGRQQIEVEDDTHIEDGNTKGMKYNVAETEVDNVIAHGDNSTCISRR